MTVLTAAPTAAPPAERVASRLRSDSLWMVAGYAATGGAGFVFWILAARLIPAAELGVDAAICAVIGAAAAFAAGLVNNLALVALPAGGRLSTIVAIAGSAALAAGAVAGHLVADLVGRPLDPAVVLLTVGLAILWTLFNVKDSILVGLGGARWTLFLNAPANALKLVALPVLVMLAHGLAHPVVVATVAPMLATCAVAFLVVLPRLMRRVPPVAPDTGAPRSGAAIARFVLRDGLACSLYAAMVLALPYLVTATVGPAQGALFALCAQLALVLDLIVSAVASALTTNAVRTGSSPAAIARNVWPRLVATVAACAALLMAGSPLLFALLGPAYSGADAHLTLGLLAGAAVLRVSYEVWAASLRAEGRPGPILAAIGAFIVLVAGGSLLALPALGAPGAALAVLLASAALAGIGATSLVRRSRRTEERA